MLLSRSHISLSYLDLTSSSGSLKPARFYVAHVRILELEQRLGSKPLVVIARLDDGESVYAVERDESGLYVLCRLGAWVDLDRLKEVAIVARHGIATRPNNAPHPASQYTTDNRGAELITPDSLKYTRTKRLAIEAIQSKVKRPVIAFSPSNPGDEAIVSQAKAVLESVSPAPLKEGSCTDIGPVQSASPDLLAAVRAQYLEALYLSKVSHLPTVIRHSYTVIAGISSIFRKRPTFSSACFFSSRL